MKKTIFILAAVIILATTANAQLKMLKDKVLGEKSPVANILKRPSPITTNFEDDVKMKGALSDTFGSTAVYVPLYKMKRDDKNAYVLCPGYYEMTNQSYCLKAGTHGPSEGDGYMYAPTKGKMDDIVNAILENHEKKHPEIPQHDVQVLLWAIIARAKFDNLSGRLKVVTALLLTPEQIIKLNGGYAETIGNEALKRGIVDVPAPVQAVMEAENNIRNLVANGVDDYNKFEEYAILAGMATADHSEVTRGMWSLHPDGYYIRYLPSGYKQTKVQIYIPVKIGEVHYNAIGSIACPANTGAQRLAQTNIPVEKPDVIFTDPCGGESRN